MEFVSAKIQYWLVQHPSVNKFQWREAETWGASTNFIGTTVVTYLSVTVILYNTFLSSKPTAKTPSSISPTFLRHISTLHNLVMVILSLLMAVGCTLSTISTMPNPSWIFCFPAKKTPPDGSVFFWAYVFYLSKILEFVDTLLIILSKDTRRLTFLHVYHHTVVLAMSYLWLRTSQSLVPVGVVTNAAVHTLMYTYYMMCTLRIKPPWKRLVTDCQIVQFWLGFAVSGVMLWLHFTGENGCSGILGWGFTALFNASLLALFSAFHASNYRTSNEHSTKGHEMRAESASAQM